MLKIKDIELANISRSRGELMGAAMLFIILFHVGLSRHDPFYGLRRCGNVGVDMFLFLSGVGLWFSWTKNPSLRHFFTRRFVRIYPAWLLAACAFYIPLYVNHHGGGYSRNVFDLVANITVGWSFWRMDDLNFWYIPATMALYLVAPFYMRLIIRHPIYRWLPMVCILWCIIVQWVAPIHHAVGHLEIFWSRVPIFLIGVNFGGAVQRKERLDGASIWMIILLFLSTFGTTLWLEQVTHGRFPLYVERMIYIPFTVTTILMLNRVFRRTPQWFNRGFRLVGALSLEAYLIHLHFVMCYIEPLHLGYWPTFLLTVAITLPLAWLLHHAIDFVVKRMFRI